MSKKNLWMKAHEHKKEIALQKDNLFFLYQMRVIKPLLYAKTDNRYTLSHLHHKRLYGRTD